MHPPTPLESPSPHTQSLTETPKVWQWNTVPLHGPQKSQLKEDNVGPTILPASETRGWRQTSSSGEYSVNLKRENCPQTNTDLYNITGFVYWGMSRYCSTDLSEQAPRQSHRWRYTCLCSWAVLLFAQGVKWGLHHTCLDSAQEQLLTCLYHTQSSFVFPRTPHHKTWAEITKLWCISPHISLFFTNHLLSKMHSLS